MTSRITAGQRHGGLTSTGAIWRAQAVIEAGVVDSYSQACFGRDRCCLHCEDSGLGLSHIARRAGYALKQRSVSACVPAACLAVSTASEMALRYQRAGCLWLTYMGGLCL